jgi:hypothetical protein
MRFVVLVEYSLSCTLDEENRNLTASYTSKVGLEAPSSPINPSDCTLMSAKFHLFRSVREVREDSNVVEVEVSIPLPLGRDKTKIFSKI